MSSTDPLLGSQLSDDGAPPADVIVQVSDPPPAVAGTAHDDQQGETGWRRFLNWWSTKREEEDEATRRQREVREENERVEREAKERADNEAARAQRHEWWVQQGAAARRLWGLCDMLKKWPLPSRVCSLSDLGLADFLESFANLATMGILSLNIYCATFFLAWHPKDSICVSGEHVPDNIKVWLKGIAACLPFTVLPITLYIAGQAKAVQRNHNALGFVSVAVMVEIIYIFALGGIMTVCAAKKPWVPVLIATSVISALLIFFWSLCCYSPRCLHGIWCCDREEDEENPPDRDEAGA